MTKEMKQMGFATAIVALVAVTYAARTWVHPVTYTLRAWNGGSSTEYVWELGGGKGYPDEGSDDRASKRGRALYSQVRHDGEHDVWQVRATPSSGEPWYDVDSWFEEDKKS